MFGQTVGFNINSKPFHTTSLGGIITLSSVIIVTLFCSNSIATFLNKEEIYAQELVSFESDPNIIQMNDEVFMIAVSIEQTNFINNPYFNITLEQRINHRYVNGTSSKTNKPINLVPCTLDRYQRITQKYNSNFSADFSRINLKDFLCPDVGAEFALGGTFSATEFNYLKLSITACVDQYGEQNLTWRPKCAPQSEMDEYLNQNGEFKIQVYLMNYIVNKDTAQTTYIQPFLDDSIFMTFIPYKLSRSSNLYIRKYQIINDISLLPIEDNHNQQVNLLAPGDYSSTSGLGRGVNDSFGEIYLRRSPYTMEIKRSYQKVQNLLAYLGGLLQFVVVVVGVVVAIYNRMHMFTELGNQLFEFQEHDDARYLTDTIINQIVQGIQKPSVDVQQPAELNSDGNEVVEQLCSMNNQPNGLPLYHELLIDTKGCRNSKEYIEMKTTQLIQKQTPLKFNIKIILNILSCRKLFNDNNSKLFHKSYERLKSHIDAHYMLDKLEEIDKLKEVLLTTDQLVMFNYTPKPKITLQQQYSHRRTLYLNQQRKMEQTQKSTNCYQEVFEAYERVSQQSQNEYQTKLSNQIIHKLGPEILAIFKLSQVLQFNRQLTLNQNQQNNDIVLEQQDNEIVLEHQDND